MDELVTVITVCYNSAQTISRTIESVLNQTYKNIEYLIIDGASTDGTLDVISDYTKGGEDRIKLVSEKDDGIYYAMNKGISMARGNLIGIINSDDWYEPDAVEIMVEQYENLIKSNADDNEYLILYGILRMVDAQGKELKIGLSDHNKLREEMIAHPTCFVSKKVYDDFGKFDTRYVSASDYDFMLRMQETGRVRFEAVNKMIANFTVGGMCASSKAYYDLMKVRRDHKIISPTQYTIEYIKCKTYDLLHGI